MLKSISKLSLALLFVCSAGLSVNAQKEVIKVTHHHAIHITKTQYQCPMDPEIVRDKPGKCPVCHMTLQKVE